MTRAHWALARFDEHVAFLVGEDQFALEVTVLTKHASVRVPKEESPGRVRPSVCR